jgi:hypothetical protein
MPNDRAFETVKKNILNDADRDKLIEKIDNIIDELAQYGNARALLQTQSNVKEYRSYQTQQQVIAILYVS